MRTQNTTAGNLNLNSWLSSVSNQLDGFRQQRRATPRPKRNRARERARREARQMFRDEELRIALQDVN